MVTYILEHGTGIWTVNQVLKSGCFFWQCKVEKLGLCHLGNHQNAGRKVHFLMLTGQEYSILGNSHELKVQETSITDLALIVDEIICID